MAPTEGRVAKPERRWGCRGAPLSAEPSTKLPGQLLHSGL